MNKFPGVRVFLVHSESFGATRFVNGARSVFVFYGVRASFEFAQISYAILETCCVETSAMSPTKMVRNSFHNLKKIKKKKIEQYFV